MPKSLQPSETLFRDATKVVDSFQSTCFGIIPLESEKFWYSVSNQIELIIA